ncbi:hypothetical protein F443_21166 [Phytophthora nicotianae P1569]|uniref:Ubiquitin-like protease family profile domain-containing protein n=2 Tax=Phytophthora nicotianae TaxID=4792 RepID=V9DYM7_PHYNI|nr:hypothetical protein F443_21166 [Phytophthora nicotianae P1569]
MCLFKPSRVPLGTQSVQSGTQEAQSGTQLAQSGEELYESRTELCESRTELCELSTELNEPELDLRGLRAELGQSGTRLVELSVGATVSASEITSREVPSQARPVNLSDNEDEFEIQSPPRAKGRPRQKPKVVKAKRNLNIAMVQEDLEMHEKQRNLNSVFELLSEDATCNASYETTVQFKLLNFERKPKPPIAYEIAKLPASKLLVKPDEITRIFPMDLIKKCATKVVAFQKKHKGVRELDIALEVVGVGVRINSALAWIDNVDLSRCDNSNFSVERDLDLPSKLKEIKVLTSQVDVLDIAGKGLITDEIMHKILAKIFGSKDGITVFDSSTLGTVVDGKVTSCGEIIRDALSGLTREKVLIPVNCNGSHWCGVMIDLEGGTVEVYDSSSSSYTMSVRVLAQTLVHLLPTSVQTPFRVRVFDSGLGVQTDSYNCGIYVLLAFEMFCGAEPLGYVDKKTLQCLWYRYLRMCL